MKKEYDLVFGIGNACSCSQAIRAAGLQFASFPFDWNATKDVDDLAVRTDMLCNDFTHWLDRDDLEFLSHNTENEKMDVYHNRRTDFLFLHDFPKGVPFEAAYAQVAAKYDRRIRRLFDMVRASRRVLVVRVDRPDQKRVTMSADCIRLRERLTVKFPGIVFDIIFLTMDRGRRFADRLEESVEPGVLRISFDYASRSVGAPAYLTESEETGAALAAHARIRDYRTPAEKREYVRKCHCERWAKLGATTFWGYQWARIRRAFSK